MERRDVPVRGPRSRRASASHDSGGSIPQHAGTSGADELLALDSALEELARLNPRQATMVESRFFGGLDVAETAELLGVSEATILRDWRAAKAWLAKEMRP